MDDTHAEGRMFLTLCGDWAMTRTFFWNKPTRRVPGQQWELNRPARMSTSPSHPVFTARFDTNIQGNVYPVISKTNMAEPEDDIG
jgi:hypothetical protein